MLEIAILAAGKGTRMCSDKPKVLHTLAGKSLIDHVVDRAKELQADNIHIVVGHNAEQVEASLAGQNLMFVQQTEQLGTGHAVQQVLPHLRSEATVLLLYGDVPLIKTETLKALLKKVSSSSMALLSAKLDNPAGYGRIVRDNNGEVSAIIEHKDANEEQRLINEINTGIMAIQGEHLQKWLPALSNDNVQGEYYLTDIIAMAAKDGIAIKTAHPANENEVLGVNDRRQQAQLERAYQREYAESLMLAGVTLLDPERIDVRGSLSAGVDCEIDVNCVFEGSVEIGNNVKIGPNCSIKDAIIGDNTTIYANCMIEESTLDKDCNIGPFARLRPGTALAKDVKIGNFVETKKAKIGKGSKVNHLSYVGDAELGSNVNVGAGTITCNYDGANKHKTTIKDEVFVGSNTALVAPVSIGEGATVGAGSVVTADVKERELVISRAKQQNVEGWKRPKKR